MTRFYRTDTKIKERQNLVIVGAGPAGMIAALEAANLCNLNCSATGIVTQVIIFDKNNIAGRKLRVTGGGHCNLTNVLTAKEQLERLSPAKQRFARAALQNLTPQNLCDYLAEKGIKTKVDNDQFHIYPSNKRASYVADKLHNLMQKCDIYIELSAEITDIILESEVDKRPRVSAITVVKNGYGKTIPVAGLILACGSSAASACGGSDAGLRLAATVGHKLIPETPALCEIYLDPDLTPNLRQLAGVSFADVSLTLVENQHVAKNNPQQKTTGAIVITHQGISGPAALDISGAVSSSLALGNQVELRIGWKAGWTIEKWRETLLSHKKDSGARQLPAILSQYLPLSLVKIVADITNSSGERLAELNSQKLRHIAEFLAATQIKVIDTGSLQQAMVACGGVGLESVNSKDLQSKLVANLYFCGEMLDIDCPCGGYNLQWAFSSGLLAGRSAALAINNT